MLISIIIPTYERFLPVQRAINSCLNQTLKNIEIIVVDDNSQNPEYKQLDNIYKEHKNVIIIHLTENMRKKFNTDNANGIVRNEGIKKANGEFIAFLDDDDEYINPYKLEYQIYVMNKYNCGMSFTNMYKGTDIYRLNEEYELFHPKNLKCYKYSSEDKNIYIVVQDCIRQCNCITNSTSVVKKEIIKKAGLQLIGKNQDYAYWINVLKYTNAIYIDIPTVFYNLGNIKHHK